MGRVTAAVGTVRCAGVILGSAALAAAQAPGPRFGVALSATFPTGDFHAVSRGDGYDAGWRAMGPVTVHVTRSPFGFRFDASYGENPASALYNADLARASGDTSRAKVALFGGDFDWTHTSGSLASVKPYLLGGLGPYRVRFVLTENQSTFDFFDTELAWNVGAGFGYDVRGVGSCSSSCATSP